MLQIGTGGKADDEVERAALGLPARAMLTGGASAKHDHAIVTAHVSPAHLYVATAVVSITIARPVSGRVRRDPDLLYVQSRAVRPGSAEVLARLARDEDADASKYTFRTSTQIESAAPEIDWLNRGVFIGVGGRQPTGVIRETYLVG